MNISLSPFASENLVSRDGFGRVPFSVLLLILHTQADLVLTHRIPPDFRGGAFIYAVNRHRVSPVFIRSRNCVPMTFTAQSPLAQGQKSSR